VAHHLLHGVITGRLKEDTLALKEGALGHEVETSGPPGAPPFPSLRPCVAQLGHVRVGQALSSDTIWLLRGRSRRPGKIPVI